MVSSRRNLCCAQQAHGKTDMFLSVLRRRNPGLISAAIERQSHCD
jgi:hypothetical protein